MFHLTREVRFAVNAAPDDQLAGKAPNSYGGFPALTGAGQYFAVAVTVTGQIDRGSSYLLNIKDVDKAVREKVIPYFSQQVRSGRFGSGTPALLGSYQLLQNVWPN